MPFDYSVGNVGQQGGLTCTLDSGVEVALMLSAGAGDSSGKDLAALADKLAKLCGILVIYIIGMVGTEDADLLSLSHVAGT